MSDEVIMAKCPPCPPVRRAKRKRIIPDAMRGDRASSRRGRRTPKLDEARMIVRELLDNDQPISPHDLQVAHGSISHWTFDVAIYCEIARRDALAEGARPVTAPIERKAVTVRALSRQQVDPDFTGTDLEFATAYGHVPMHTKAELAAGKRHDTVTDWLAVVGDFARAARAVLAVPPPDPAALAAWLAKPAKLAKMSMWSGTIKRAADAMHAAHDGLAPLPPPDPDPDPDPVAAVARFIRNGMAAQAAVDTVIATATQEHEPMAEEIHFRCDRCGTTTVHESGRSDDWSHVRIKLHMLDFCPACWAILYPQPTNGEPPQ
jgi:hypothetical protein